jgi:hypothetical protein
MSHNKKRNIGIVYELLLRHMSNCLLENNIKELKKTTKIIERRFNKETEIFKEFRVFNALSNSTIASTEIAASIITESKSSIRRIDNKKLKKEKGMLIKEINYILKDKLFYHRHIKNYKDLATIQKLINEWKNKDKSNLKKTIILEGELIDYLLKTKTKEAFIDLKKKVIKENNHNELVFKIMTEKINKKYKILTENQKEIIKNYVFYCNTNTDILKERLNKVKNNGIIELNKFKNNSENEVLNEKFSIVENKIKNLNCKNITETNILKFLVVSKLVDELIH